MNQAVGQTSNHSGSPHFQDAVVALLEKKNHATVPAMYEVQIQHNIE